MLHIPFHVCTAGRSGKERHRGVCDCEVVRARPQVCEDLKIQSQNDEKKLEEAKGLVYLKGFTDGVMAAGSFSGEKVAAAKPKIRQELLDAGEAVVYAEPEGRVVSRSDDECVVALTDQWCAPLRG